MPNAKKIIPLRERYTFNIGLLSGSKKILVGQTPALLVFAFLLFKAANFLWLQDVVPEFTLYELIVCSPSWLRAHPAVAGLLTSFLTWHVVYLDSVAPGIDPPTPLSPSKYKAMSGADFHLNYVFSLVVGPMVAALLYLGLV